ncbi:YhjD/YihY/BrkB family envelope integrity protein [Microbacterium suwonense]|uniref:YihY/virulence factor BrkB family protein n=1 Tax=Microbacterium suwonense TaxID=683047 RepID=A0ABM8FT33_9MICO|nr:YhjD/YihY/BrkB family envelope integrity protein [Microbacterium suwonense]BDZ38666.1 hypothetical protein GCM10025863_12800 [Microbacterium suwonense]
MEGSSDSERPGLFARVSATLIRRLLRWRLVRAALLYTGRRGPVLADAVTYRALFSVFAAVLLGFSAAALWLSGNEQAWDAVVSAVDSALPGLIATSDGEGIVDLDVISAPGGLSIAGIVSLIGLVGSALGAIGTLRTAMRTIAGTIAADSAWYLVMLRNLALALLIAVAFAGAAALTFAGDVIVHAIGSGWGSPTAVSWGVRIVSLLVVFALNAVLIGSAFRILSGVRASGRALWSGAALGALALLVLQELSGLFVGGAKSNPLLVSFASLLALLLWLNLSTQVILLSSAFIVVSVQEERDRVAAKYGADTLADAAVRLAEDDVRAATAALRSARSAADREH